MTKYKYDPLFLDSFQPNVIRGSQIASGSIVTITKKNFDPANIFRFIKDDKGNVQSVYKDSLVKCS